MNPPKEPNAIVVSGALLHPVTGRMPTLDDVRCQYCGRPSAIMDVRGFRCEVHRNYFAPNGRTLPEQGT